MKNRSTNTTLKDVNMFTSGSHFAYDHSEEEMNYSVATVNKSMVTLEIATMLTMAAIIIATYLGWSDNTAQARKIQKPQWCKKPLWFFVFHPVTCWILNGMNTRNITNQKNSKSISRRFAIEHRSNTETNRKSQNNATFRPMLSPSWKLLKYFNKRYIADI